MRSVLIETIISNDADVRDRSLDAVCAAMDAADLRAECDALESFRHYSSSLYERVRALFYLYAIHRFHLPRAGGLLKRGTIPFRGYEHLLQRRFEEAIRAFLEEQRISGPSVGITSALAEAYHRLGFQTLADQVRRSVRSVRGNQWMFRMGHPMDHPLRIRRELLTRTPGGLYPILHEATPVRMDLSHSGWSDIFFLGMDYPEGARVLNVSIDLAVRGRDPYPTPPVEAFLRVIDDPVLRFTSVDLGASADVHDLSGVFDFAGDYLGLLKAAVIAAGIVPPGIEGSGEGLSDLLTRLVGPDLGLEIVSRVNGIPKGSRLAVSTSLLACLIAVCMRATGQAQALTGQLAETERRLVAARAILGEWLAGSGGGWQDSGGVWPGMKLITGEFAGAGDPEYTVSRGRLLPAHHILGDDEVSPETRRRLQESLVLVHGGMAQDVGPILEMVTEKYLLRSGAEWRARQEAMQLFDHIVAMLRAGSIPAIGEATTRNFFGPIETIIPWANNLYTATLVDRVRELFGTDFWGFWMLGGMSGGGMGFIFDAERKAEAQTALLELMLEVKADLVDALPFAMDPVVYDFAINQQGTVAELLAHDVAVATKGLPGQAGLAMMPTGYYTLVVPRMLRVERHALSPVRRTELDAFGALCRAVPVLSGTVQVLFDQLLPRSGHEMDGGRNLSSLLDELGFDRVQHEQIRADLKAGRIGLAQNRLPATTEIRDVEEADVLDLVDPDPSQAASLIDIGRAALADGQVAVVTLAAGVGSRWTHGAGVVKALHPFCKLDGAHRTFAEVHLAKSRRVSRTYGAPVSHVITTSYLTHDAIERFLKRRGYYGYVDPLLLSPGRTVGLRLVPTVRDLRFAWEEMPQQVLDEQAQKVRESLRAALTAWAVQMGEAADYRDNVPLQCLHPVGHWFEIPNMLKNGVLARLLSTNPRLKILMVHNIDTVGTDVSPLFLGAHIASGATMTMEVTTRQVDDRGGGLARVDGALRLVEGMALPHEEDEFRLSYYSTNTAWIDIDRLLGIFGLDRSMLADAEAVATAIRALAARMPTYVTIKDVKKRWGHGQEDVFPVAQFEKLWGDMTALPEMDSRFVSVPRVRGQQLKEQAQLDGWVRDGSAAYTASLCDWA